MTSQPEIVRRVSPHWLQLLPLIGVLSFIGIKLLFAQSISWFTVAFVGFGSVFGAWMARNAGANQASSSVVTPLAAEAAINLVQSAILKWSSRRVSSNELEIAIPTSIWSFGENITVQAEPLGRDASRLNIKSTSAFRGTLVDWGKNKRNIEHLLTLLEGPLATAVSMSNQRHQADRSKLVDTEHRLALLQAQVETHFLFNTLAHVRAQMTSDPSAAKDMLDALVEYLRTASKQLRSISSTLDDERRLITGYLTVMQYRLGNRLQFHIDIPEALRSAACLPGVLLPLVENAIKHGLEPSPQGGSITVSAQQDGNFVRVDVVDTGLGFGASSGSGLGVANLKERLMDCYGTQAGLSLEMGTPSGVVARVRFPMS